MQTVDTPESAGLDSGRWQTVLDTADGLCRDGHIPSIGLLVGRSGKTLGVQTFGHQTLGTEPSPLRPDAIFLIASITKPIVAMGCLVLVERGLISLQDRVSRFLPAFATPGKRAIQLRHLLTHTSGLPDMLPDNRELREAEAPLSRFVERTAEITADFLPGRAVQYQSMGFAVLGQLIEQISGVSCAAFLQREFFDPLGMANTTLGAPAEWFAGEQPRVERIAEIRVPAEQEGANWNWNHRYWRMLGAPWGGLLTTPEDLGRYCEMMLAQGQLGAARVLGPATVAAATQNQLTGMPDVPDFDRRCRPWGLGWRLHWPAHTANFGDFLGPATYGHWGATGTVLWIDPDRQAFAVILTTQPQEPHGSYLARLSNGIAAAMM